VNVTLSLGPLIGFGDKTFVLTDGQNRRNTHVSLSFDSLQFVERTCKGGKDHTQREEKKRKKEKKKKIFTSGGDKWKAHSTNDRCVFVMSLVIPEVANVLILLLTRLLSTV